MSRKTLYRSAITGKIVTKKHALENPDTTVKETVCLDLEKELNKFKDFVVDNVLPLDKETVKKYLNQK